MPHPLETVAQGSPEDCWLHTGKVGSAGYPLVRYKGKQWLSHRLVYQLYCGQLREGLVVMHICENKRCLNPKHLRQDTQSSNMQQACTTGVWRSGTTKVERGDREKVVQLLRDGMSRKEVCLLLGISSTTISRVVKCVKERAGEL